MRPSVFLATIVLLTISAIGHTTDAHLEGCVDPSLMAKALSKLRDSNWDDISLSRLRLLWPAELAGLNCDAEVCDSVWSKDRIIGGHCQCCTTFSFLIHQQPDGSRKEQLEAITINYSSAQRDDIVNVAKMFARATGLGEAELETVGSDTIQNYHWQTGRGKAHILSGIEIHFSREGRLWELFFYFGRDLIEPPSE